MRVSRLLLIAPALVLCGCASGHSAATYNATSGPQAHLTAIPQTTPPPIVGKAHSSRKGTTKSLPTAPPIRLPTATPIPARDYTAVLRGNVINAKTHTPVKGAIVRLVTGGHQTSTDASGHYQLKFPGNVPIPVTVSRHGFAQQLAMGRLGTRQIYHLNFNLTPTIPGKPIAPPAPSLFGTH